MVEKDYLLVAKSRSEEEILEQHWTTVAKTHIWVDRVGKEVKFEDLDVRHICNIINGLATFKSKSCALVIKELTSELLNRFSKKLDVKGILDNLEALYKRLDFDSEAIDIYFKLIKELKAFK